MAAYPVYSVLVCSKHSWGNRKEIAIFTFLLQVFEFAYSGQTYVFMVMFFLIIVIWVSRIYLSRGYQPWQQKFAGHAGVVIPVIDENPQNFSDVLARVQAQKPDELIVVINGRRNPDLENVCQKLDVEFICVPTASKRQAVAAGVAQLTSEIVVILDSDTIWEPQTMAELLKPFNDKTVGGVTTRQKIVNPKRTFLTRWANWLEAVRFAYSMPAMSQIGNIGCLPGRTIALRKEIITKNMKNFLSEKFLGFHQEISDDRSLTNYALKDGWKTVYQSSSVVLTDAPTGLSKFAQQQFRWAKGSQYNTLKMFNWMIFKTQWLAFFYSADILIPFLALSLVFVWALRIVLGVKGTNYYLWTWQALGANYVAIALMVLIAIVISWLFAAIRFSRVLRESPSEFWLIPLYLLANTFILLPIRIHGFFRLGFQGNWQTRAGAYKSERTFRMLSFVPYGIGFALVSGITLFGVFF